MDAEMGAVAISPKHQARLALYIQQHEDEGLTEEMIVERALDTFFNDPTIRQKRAMRKDQDQTGESMDGVLATLSMYKYL
jgi:hypothetical protein